MPVFPSGYECSLNVPTNVSIRKALKSLQNVACLHGLVVPCEEVQFPGVVVGHLTGRW
jgi:hypothetical protein